MKIQQVMSTNVRTIGLEASIREAASLMLEENIGAVPVTDDDRLAGMLTDRDIVVRVVASGHDPEDVLVRDVMTSRTLYCFVDDDSERVAQNMVDEGVLRMPVVDRNKKLVGIVSAGDLHQSGATRANDQKMDGARKSSSGATT